MTKRIDGLRAVVGLVGSFSGINVVVMASWGFR